jgi:aryl-alcohol dehydrogenase-like predicted oxidoreductase
VLVQLRIEAIFVALCSLALVAAYPFMKRITWWPQLWLGLVFSWGALVGWVAVTGGADAAMLWLYGGTIFWVVGYDTIYAMQDREDDALVGIRSTALRMGEHIRSGVALCYLLALGGLGHGDLERAATRAGAGRARSCRFALGISDRFAQKGWKQCARPFPVEQGDRAAGRARLPCRRRYRLKRRRVYGQPAAGKSAIVVSDICMGTMTFGSQADEAVAHRVLDMSLDAGINFFDTAEGYPVPPDPKWVGRTEEIVGRWLKGKNRDAIIIATKVSGPSHVWFKSPKRGGMTALDRRKITVAVEDSLRRLQTDYIDLYQTHWPDHGTPYEETMEVLDELVRAGKVRIIGCSNETSWGLMKSIQASERLGVARYQTIQNNFSINNRRFEDELAQVCREEGVSLIPYSPLARRRAVGQISGWRRGLKAHALPAIWKCSIRGRR